MLTEILVGRAKGGFDEVRFFTLFGFPQPLFLLLDEMLPALDLRSNSLDAERHDAVSHLLPDDLHTVAGVPHELRNELVHRPVFIARFVLAQAAELHTQELPPTNAHNAPEFFLRNRNESVSGQTPSPFPFY